MFTICIALYTSLVSVDAIGTSCYTDMTQADVATAVAECKAIDHDPLTTCEARRAGALKWFITIRKLEGV